MLHDMTPPLRDGMLQFGAGKAYLCIGQQKNAYPEDGNSFFYKNLYDLKSLTCFKQNIN